MPNYPGTQNTDDNLYVAVNNLSTVLDGGITAGDTTITVADTTGFPSVGIITIDLEAIHYTGTTATTFTGCTRGFDGTTAAAHSDTQTVFHDIPAAHHNVLKDELKSVTDDLRDAFTADLDDAATIAATATDLKERLDHIVTQVKNITGGADWKTVPAETLSSLETSKAEDSAVVHLAGSETITGAKTFSSDLTMSSSQVLLEDLNLNSAPDLAWAVDPDTGLRLAGASINFVSGGAQIGNISSTTFGILAGTAGSPSLSFLGDSDTGLYSDFPNVVRITCGGTLTAQYDTSNTPGHTRLAIYDVDNGQIERVVVGAPDSGGTGYKVLRIPN